MRLGPPPRLDAILAASPDRRPPSCPVFGRCGGCALQHLPDARYAALKEAAVTAALRRHGLEDVQVAPLLRLPPGTRRRASLALLRLRGGAARVGFHGAQSHEVVDLPGAACAVLDPGLARLADALRGLVGEGLLAPGERGAASLTLTGTGLDVVLDLPQPPDLGGLERLAAFAEREGVARLAWRSASGRASAAVPVAERARPSVAFDALPVDVPSGAFLQASPDADAALLGLVRAALAAAPRVLDLHAGLGTFALPLAKAGAAVRAVDESEAALTALQRAAARAGLAGRLTVERRDLELRPLSGAELAGFDAAIFDPPRAGAHAQATALAAAGPPVVVAVSCNPATFGRDARILVDGGYRPTIVTPVDQFIWSSHVELVAGFVRG